MNSHSTRRRFLRMLGLGGAAAMLPSIRWRQNANASNANPPRVVFFDVTRVMSLNVGQLAPDVFGAPSGSDVHQDWAHGTSNEAYMHMANYYRYHAEQFAAFVNYLDSIPEGDCTLLDNTMVVWITELSTGGHDHGLTVVAGGGDRNLSPGRYIRFAQNRPAARNSYGCQSGASIGPAQSHLFVSAMQHMDMPDNSFNMASGQAVDGSPIDLSGPLPML